MITRTSYMQKSLALLLSFLISVSVGCNRSTPPKTETGQDTQTGAPQTTAAAPMTPQYLDELLAPVALYPDVLLVQILSAATNPQEVLDGGNWLLQNTNLKGTQLVDAAKKAGFGPAMLALVQFPQVVDMMCQEMDWTKQIGEAFKADQKSVLDSVQRLRQQAVQAGSLKTTPQQNVETEKQNGKQVVTVQPANPQVVYVPQYNPQQVYSAPAQTSQQTQTKEESGVSTGTAVAASLLTFGVGIAVGSALNNHDEYYYPNWGYGGVYYGGRPWVPSAYAYRPAYTSYYRPATGYARPANYPNAWDRPYTRNSNIAVEQNNYFNQFHNNANVQNRRSPATQSANNWKGQSTYAGSDRQNSRNANQRAVSDVGKGTYAGANRQNPRTPSQGGASANTRTMAANRDTTASVASNRNAAASNLGANANRETQAPARNMSQSREAGSSRSFGSADRGYGGGQTRRDSDSGGSSAFSGSGSRRSEAAASDRGRSSVRGSSGREARRR